MLDLMIIAILLLFMGMGFKVGFIRTVYQLTSSIVALIIAQIIAPIIEGLLRTTGLDEWMDESIRSYMPDVQIDLGLQGQAQFIREVTSWLPDSIGDKLIENNNPEMYAALGVEKLIDYVVVSMTNIAMWGLAIILAFIIIKIGLGVSIGVLDLVSKLPIIRTANELLGAVAGGAKGIIIIWLICTVISMFITLPEFEMTKVMLEESTLAKLFYENNLILNFITEHVFK